MCPALARITISGRVFCGWPNSGTPLRPKAAKVEPHTHTKRYAGDFLWSWQAEWLAGACAVHTYIHTYVHRIS